MKEIKRNGKVYSISGDTRHCKRGHQWWTKKGDSLQVLTYRLPCGHKVQRDTDYHNGMRILTVLCGRIKCNVFNKSLGKIGEVIILPGEFAVFYGEEQEFEILDDGTNAIEINNDNIISGEIIKLV